MPRKNLIESSDHFDEIVERLARNESGATVSAWLKNEYNEIISPRTLNRYKATKIKMEERVEAELNKRAEKKKRKIKQDKNIEKNKSRVDETSDKSIQMKVDIIESAEETLKSVSETIADNMQGVARVAAQFPKRFEQACRDAKDPDSNVTSKDIARLALDANKLYNDYFKDTGPDVEVNVNNNIPSLTDSIEASRQKYVKWKEEQAKKK